VPTGPWPQLHLGRPLPLGNRAVELYDQQADPQEDVNIANDPKNADLVARLTQQWLKGWEGAKLVK
jgi:hypothetical protein